jgi:hypothetical protein
MVITSPMSSDNTFNNYLKEDNDNPYSTHISNNELLIIQQSIKWNNGSWTPEEKKVLHSKMSRCFILKESHWEIARKCAKRYKLINFPKVICSTILASSLTLFTQQEQNNMLFIYFNATLSIFVAILTTSSSFFDYNVQKARHRSSSLGYGKLAVYIDRVLRLPPDERETFGDTLAKVNEEYASLRTEAPFLNSWIVSKYTKIYRPPVSKGSDEKTCIMETDNAYQSGICSDISHHKKGIMDHIMTNRNLGNNLKIDISRQDHRCIENEEYFNPIIDSVKTKRERLTKILAPLVNNSTVVKARPSPILPIQNVAELSKSSSNSSIDSYFQENVNIARSSHINVPISNNPKSNKKEIICNIL